MAVAVAAAAADGVQHEKRWMGQKCRWHSSEREKVKLKRDKSKGKRDR